MKLIDDKGRLFGKISILDIIAILVLLILIFFTILKITNKDISEVSEGSAMANVRYTVECEGMKGLFESVKVGDKAGEQKNYLPSEVIEVIIEPIELSYKDEKGEIIMTKDPVNERAFITYQATLPHQSQSLKLGKQEIRYGQKIFAESDCYRLEGIIVGVEVDD